MTRKTTPYMRKPSDAEIDNLTVKHLVLMMGGESTHEPCADMRPVVRNMIRAVLARWGTPQAAIKDKGMNDTELKPCPFCGERAETDFIPEHHSYQVECSDSMGCTARIIRDSELGAIEAWNCRAAIAAPAQAVPAPGVEAVSEREFKQFLSDVLTAAGLVTHGKKCKDLGRRLGEMSMRLLTAPKTAAAPVQAQDAWNPIETAPKDKSNVVLLRQPCGSVANGYFLAEAYAGNGAWIWPYIHKNPTHWMPLPAPPAAIAAQ